MEIGVLCSSGTGTPISFIFCSLVWCALSKQGEIKRGESSIHQPPLSFQTTTTLKSNMCHEIYYTIKELFNASRRSLSNLTGTTRYPSVEIMISQLFALKASSKLSFPQSFPSTINSSLLMRFERG